MSDRKRKLHEIRQMLERKRLSLIPRFLESKGVMHALAHEISSQVEGVDLDQLQRTIASHIRTLPEISFAGKKPLLLALVGPTGVGKTTTLLKMADHYARVGGKKVGVISIDATKGGAFAQIECYTTIWKIPFYQGLDKLPLLDDCDLVLIDTSGCNFYLPEKVEQMGLLLASLPQVKIHLTLSAATKDADIYGAIHQFSALRPQGLIFTKLDETLCPGILLNVSCKSPIPISYVAFGYPLPGEIRVAQPLEIAHKILTDLNEGSFQALRQLSLREDT